MPKPVDPDVKIPAVVLAAGAKAEELHKKIYSKEEEPAPETPPAEPAASAEPAPQPDHPQPTPVITQLGNDDDSWKHKYLSMKGRHDRLADQIREQADQVANLQAIIATMQQPTEPAVPRELAPQSLLTQEEIEQFGPDFIAVVGKKAKEIAAAETAAMRRELEDLRTKVTGVGNAFVQSSREKMLAKLAEEVPNWQAMNNDQKFLAWLGLPDAFSGVIRHNLLSAAYEQNDTPRVVAFFKGFLAEEAATAPQAAQPDPTTNEVAKVPLEALAAPGRAKTAAPHRPPAEKPIINRAFISQFYVDVAAGKFRGRDDEKARIEQDIFAAQREGRIR